MAPLRIDRCVCTGRRFEELLAIADASESSSIAELQRHVDFGRGCGLCHPYVRRTLATREVVFSEVIEQRWSPPG